MKKPILLVCIVLSILIVGCDTDNRSTPTSLVKLTPPPQSTERPVKTTIPTSTLTGAPTALTNEHLQTQCLDVAPVPSHDNGSSGIVILQNSSASAALLMNMTTREFSPIMAYDEKRANYKVSPDKKLLAYQQITSNTEGVTIRNELVIATSNGQALKMLPLEAEWARLVDWLDNQHLIISLASSDPEENAGTKPATLLILNPFTDEQKFLRPDYPGYLDMPSTIVPYWDGWSGVIYNPDLTRAIYPRFVGSGEQIYTYAVWDLTDQKLLSTLENEFTAFSVFNDKFPIPRWSPDGSQFVFRGMVFVSDELVAFELYRVALDGQVDQLTQLTSSALVQDSNFSWSPDGRYIAVFLNDWGDNIWETSARVAVLNMETLELTDYCIQVNGKSNSGGLPSSPIWSPDSKQFLVADWHEENNQRVILVDIEKGFASQIAEGMEPVGWMIAP